LISTFLNRLISHEAPQFKKLKKTPKKPLRHERREEEEEGWEMGTNIFL